MTYEEILKKYGMSGNGQTGSQQNNTQTQTSTTGKNYEDILKKYGLTGENSNQQQQVSAPAVTTSHVPGSRLTAKELREMGVENPTLLARYLREGKVSENDILSRVQSGQKVEANRIDVKDPYLQYYTAEKRSKDVNKIYDFNARAGEFAKEVQELTEKGGYLVVSDDLISRGKKLEEESREIASYVRSNARYLENTEQFEGLVSDLTKGLGILKDLKDFYGSFENEDEYNKAIAVSDDEYYKRRDAALAYNVEKGQQEVDQFLDRMTASNASKAELANIELYLVRDPWSNEIDWEASIYEYGDGAFAGMSAAQLKNTYYNLLYNLDERSDDKSAWVEEWEKLKSDHEYRTWLKQDFQYDMLRENADFIEKSNEGERLTGGKIPGEKTDEMYGYEKYTYYYIYATEGEDAAKKYVKHLKNTLRERRGADIARFLETRYFNGAASTVYGLFTGMADKVRDVGEWFTDLDDAAWDYANDKLQESHLLTDTDKWFHRAGQNVGGMIPGMVLKAVNPVLGWAFEAASNYGSSEQEARKMGLTKSQQIKYGLLMSAGETAASVVTDKIFGTVGLDDAAVNKKIATLGKAWQRVGLKLASKVGSEEIEELSQEIFWSPAVTSMLTGEDFTLPNAEQILETVAMTALSTLILGAPGDVKTEVKTQQNYKAVGQSLIDSDKVGNLKATTLSKMVDMNNSDFRVTNRLYKGISDSAEGLSKRGQAAKVGQLYTRLSQAEAVNNASADRIDISHQLQQKGYEPNKAKAIADALVAQNTGQELTRDQRKTLKQYKSDEVVNDIVEQIWSAGKGNVGQDTSVSDIGRFARDTLAKRAAGTPVGEASPVPTEETGTAHPSDPASTATETEESPTDSVPAADASGVAPSPMSVYESTLALGTNAAADPVSAAVDALAQTGNITNKQIQDILNSTTALDNLREQTGIPIKGTNEERSTAIRQAIAQLAQQNTVDTTAQTDYDNVTNQGGIENGNIQAETHNRGIQRDTQRNTGGEITGSPGDGSSYASSSTQIGNAAGGNQPPVYTSDSEGRTLNQEHSVELQGTAITDDSGAPLAVYHVTDNTEFTNFEVGDTGFHFGSAVQAENHKQKRNYRSGRMFRVYLNIKNPYHAKNDIMGWTPAGTSLYLWSEGVLTEAEHREVLTLWKDGDGYNSPSAIRLREIIESKGYDGISYPNEFEGKGYSYMAFHDSQIIKSEITHFGENTDTDTPSPTDSVGAGPSVPSDADASVSADSSSATATPSPVADVLTDTPKSERNQRGLWSWMKEKVFDKGMVFETLALKTKNRELQAKWNSTRYAKSRAQNLIGNGADGIKSLNAIRKEVQGTGKTKQFYEYLYHRHNIDRMQLETRFKDTKNKPVFGDTVTAEVSKDAVQKYENENPSFKQLANDVYAYMNHLRQLLVSNGVISQDTADLWSSMYPNYVPIQRAGKSGRSIDIPLDTGRTAVSAPVKKATGGSSDILPLFDTMAQRTLQTYTAIAKNSFGVELKNTLGSVVSTDTPGVDEVIEGIDSQDGLLQSGKDGKSPTFTVFENGKRVTFEVTEEMYDALKPTSEGMAYTNKIAKAISNFHRGLLTEYNPTFMLTNAIKDVQDVLINSQHPAKTYAKIPQAYVELAKKGKWYKEYVSNGGEMNTYFDTDNNIFASEDTLLSKVPPFSTISKINSFIEMAPRLAEYIASREAGSSIDVAMLDAARVTTNFAAGGELTKLLNRNGATFLNASVQGAVQQVRNVREAKMNGLKGWVGLATKFIAAGLPAMLLNGLVWEDDEDYADLSNYVKDNYYIVGKYGDGQFVRIPKGRTTAVIQNALEQMGNLITGDDEVDMQRFLDLAVSNLAPNNPIDNNILSPIVQTANNETWYGEDLVPERLQDLPDAEQYDESTDAFSKWLGEKLDYSPVKINYLLDQYGGGVSDVVLPMLTPQAESGDNSIMGNILAPLKDKFTTDSVMNNQNVTDFYDITDDLTTKAKASNATVEDQIRYKYINSVNSQLSDLYAKKREVQNSNLPTAQKYEKVRSIQKKIDNLAKNALNSYQNPYSSDKYHVVGNIVGDSLSDLTKCWKNGSDTANAIASMDEAYNAYGKMDDASKEKIKAEGGRVADFLKARENGLSSQTFVDLYKTEYTFSSISESWKKGEDSTSAVSDLDSAYASFEKLSPEVQQKVIDSTSGRVKDYFDARKSGMTAEEFIGSYRVEYTMGNAFDSLVDSWKKGESNTAATADLEKAWEHYSGLSYKARNSLDNALTGRQKDYITARKNGISAEVFSDLYGKYYNLNNDSGKTAKEKASEWSLELERARASGKITTAQRDILKNEMYFNQSFRAETERFDGFVEKGIPAETASYVDDLLNDLIPEKGKTAVSNIQKIETISHADSYLTESQQQAAMEEILPEAYYAKYQEILKLGMDTDDYAKSYRIYLEEADKGGKGVKARTIEEIQIALRIPYDEAKKLYEIYKPPAKKSS